MRTPQQRARPSGWHAQLPTLVLGRDQAPRSCAACGSAFLSSEPPLGSRIQGQVGCETCGRTLAWLAPGPRSSFPVSRPAVPPPLPLSPSPVVRSILVVRRIAVGRWERTETCGPAVRRPTVTIRSRTSTPGVTPCSPSSPADTRPGPDGRARRRLRPTPSAGHGLGGAADALRARHRRVSGIQAGSVLSARRDRGGRLGRNGHRAVGATVRTPGTSCASRSAASARSSARRPRCWRTVWASATGCVPSSRAERICEG